MRRWSMADKRLGLGTIEAEAAGPSFVSAASHNANAWVVCRDIIPPLGDVLKVYEVLKESPEPGRSSRGHAGHHVRRLGSSQGYVSLFSSPNCPP